jgi:hypothetical protein
MERGLGDDANIGKWEFSAVLTLFAEDDIFPLLK